MSNSVRSREKTKTIIRYVMQDAKDFTLQLPQFSKDSIEYKMCAKITELTQVIQLMHTRTEGNEHLLNLKEKENRKIMEKLEKKIKSRDNIIKELTDELKKSDIEHREAINALSNSLNIEKSSAEGIARERKKISKQLLQTERDLNLAKDDVCRARIIINEKDEIIKRFELLHTGAKEHNEQLKKEISVLRKELSRSQTEAAGLREDQTKLQSSFAASERRNNVLKGKLAQLQSPQSIRSHSAVLHATHNNVTQSGRNTKADLRSSQDEKLSMIVAGYERKCLYRFFYIMAFY
ncbi:unnamed protein product [Oikopleura dioica]|uniref:Uncharacterized protein n=1 Tax=Oikopleura dioica TaxID=34765 RepID=E4YF85_OIKDI|nr:unnamed protein product [Oikopleura dioica]